MNRVDPRQAHLKPLPEPDPDTASYWHGLKNGKLLLQHCLDCGHVQFYQQSICRKCGQENLEHRAACGLGTVYSFSVVHRAPGPAFKEDTPYAVLLVDLDEGPRMISRLVETDADDVYFEMRVELVCKQISDDIFLPCFKPTLQKYLYEDSAK